LFRLMVLTGALLLTTGVATAQDYPSRVIRIITTAPGGFADVSSRLVADGLSKRVGQPVIVDNRSGALIAMETAIKANPDGYNLFLYGNAVWMGPLIFPTLPYDPLKELTPITLTTRVPYIIVVNPSVPAKSLSELIALAKAKPGELNYGAGNTTGTPNTAARLMSSMAGIDITHIPYKSTGPALLDVMAGRIQMMVSAASAMSYAKAGKIRALAVTSLEPTPLAAGLPTVSATLPGYDVVSTMAIFVPAKVPTTIVSRLNKEVVAVLSSPEAKEKFFAAGADTVPTSPEQALAAAKSERQRLGKIVKELGPGES